MSVSVILDCDPGIDDALALALLIGRADVDLVGVTTVAGNVALPVTTANALRLCSLFDRTDVPVVAGASVPLRRSSVFADYVHGADGLGGAPVPSTRQQATSGFGPDFIIEQLRARPGEITLIAVGPMTNVALALRKEPRITEWVKQVVVMGGAWTRGNITPAAEFNFYADPDAAAIVLDAEWQPVLTTLDLTLQARVDDQVMDRWRAFGSLSSSLLVPALANYFDNRAAAGTIRAPRSHISALGGPAVHDAAAAAYAIAPELFTAMPAKSQVETRGELTAGMSVVDFTSPAPNSTVLTELDVDGFWTLLEKSFTALARRMQQR